MQRLRRLPGKLAIAGCQGQRRGQAARHFQGEARPGQDAILECLWQCFRSDLVRQLRGICFKSFARPDYRNRRRQLRNLAQRGSQGGNRHGDQYEFRAGKRIIQVGSEVQRLRQCSLRQVALVAAAGAHRGDLCRIARP